MADSAVDAGGKEPIVIVKICNSGTVGLNGLALFNRRSVAEDTALHKSWGRISANLSKESRANRAAMKRAGPVVKLGAVAYLTVLGIRVQEVTNVSGRFKGPLPKAGL